MGSTDVSVRRTVVQRPGNPWPGFGLEALIRSPGTSGDRPLNRQGADARRDRLLEDVPTRAGFDRDEYLAAVGRGKANDDLRGLVRGINPVGWMVDVAYLPSSENRSHGSSLGAKLRGFCNGTRFEYAFA